MVRARQDFLERGYYAPLRDALCSAATRYAGDGCVNYFDAGCGTGYYTDGVFKALLDAGESLCAGVDISKDAVRLCAKRIKSAEFAVASLYDLPFADSTFDIVTNVFSPMADSELLRVMKSGGVLLYATPAAKHLFSMKSVLYDKPYENEETVTEYEGFSHVERISVDSSATLDSEAIQSLFAMTPYFWRTPEEGVKRLREKQLLDIEFSFYIHVYKKV
jgi:23S rRNA (guanine745-N1)-methyltransferase